MLEGIIEPTREIYWNIDIPFRAPIVIGQAFIPLAIMIYGLKREYMRWRALGEGKLKWDNPLARLRRVLVTALFQPRILLRRFPAVMHLSLFYAMVILFIGTCVVAFQEDFADPVLNWHFFKGAFYLWFSLILDCAGLVAMAALGLALWRRFVIKPKFLGQKSWTPILFLLLIILIQGFVLEGLRIAALRPSWGGWSPVGQTVALCFGGLSVETLTTLHGWNWWTHLVFSEAFIALAGFTPLNHFWIVLLNVFFGEEIPTGRLAPIPNMEDAEEFGVDRVELFTSKQLLDAAACVRCGRCEQVCPAYATGKPLNPKQIIGGVKRAWEPRANAALLKLRPDYAEMDKLMNNGGKKKKKKKTAPTLIGEAIEVDALWACTTCGACERECPVLIPQIDKIVDMRRNLVLMQSDFPEELMQTFTNIENEGNPWGVSAMSRGDWAVEQKVKVLDEGEQTPLLYWVGCAGACDSRAKKVTESMVKILRAAGVEFAVLGTAETCTGDPARRGGNEYLFSMMAEQNIETLQSHGARKILTQCPHCFNTLQNEYPDFGGNYEVIHHGEFIEQLIEEGKIKLKNGARETITFHDPCYLGRINRQTREPRAVLDALPGSERVEMERHGERSFCCGAGGARMWMEETIGTQINNERTREAIETGAGTIAVGCPFCMTMISDGVKNHGKADSVGVKDLAELVAEALVDAP